MSKAKMTEAEYAEFKRVCRIRGVPEPPEPTEEAFCAAQREASRQELKALAEEIKRNPLVWTPGAGFPVPSVE